MIALTQGSLQTAALTADLLGNLALDIRCEAASQWTMQQVYGSTLTGSLPWLRETYHARSDLQAPLLVLERFATFVRSRPANLVPPVDLRQAAESVYATILQDFGPFDDRAIRGGMAAFGLRHRMPEHLPSNEEHQANFLRLSSDLRQTLEAIGENLTRSRRGVCHLGADLEHSPYFLRAAVIEWLAEHLPTTDLSRKHISVRTSAVVEILNWLTNLPLTYSHDFFQMLFRHPKIARQGGGEYIRSVVDRVNSIHRTSFCISTTEEKRAAPDGHTIRRGLYNVKSLAPNQQLERAVETIARNPRIVEILEESSAMPRWLFYSHRGLPEGLCRALVTLNPLDKDGLSPQQIRQRLRIIATIFDLFLGPSPILETKGFFHPRLIHAGVSIKMQKALVAAVNQAWGTAYRHCRSRYLRMEGDPSSVPLSWEEVADPAIGSPPSLPDVKSVPPANFKKGQWVVYPGVGVGQVEEIEARAIGEHEVRFFVIRLINTRSTSKIRVAEGSAGGLGLRTLSDPSSVIEAKRILGQANGKLKSFANPGRASEHRAGLLREGTPEKLAELIVMIHNIGAHQGEPFFEKALTLLAAELSLIEGVSVEDEKAELTAILQRRPQSRT